MAQAEAKTLFTVLGGEQYQQFSESGGYRVSILGIAEAMVPHLKGRVQPPQLLEVGGGQGRSDNALTQALLLNGITDVGMVITEPDLKLLKVASSGARVLNTAEALPFARDIADVVWGSQVSIGSKTKMP